MDTIAKELLFDQKYCEKLILIKYDPIDEITVKEAHKECVNKG